MKRYFIGVVLALLFPLIAFAQSGRVEVRMDGSANSAINAARSTERVSGYRVCIFSDNSQTGRAAASAAVGQLRSILPGVPAEVTYQNPFFRAYAGYCLNKIEATRLLGRLRSAFPRAIIVGESFTVSNFVGAYQDVIEADSVGTQSVEADL